MLSNYKPKDIKIYRDFPVEPGEITIELENNEISRIYVYRRVVIRNSELVPVAEGKLEITDMPSASSSFSLKPGQKLNVTLTMDLENVNRLEANHEYNALIQYNRETDFAWTDKMLENLELFRNWNNKSGLDVVAEIACLLPVDLVTVPLHVRALSKSHIDLCLDFGTSFSTCAISINPALSHQLACFRNTDKPKSIYYTSFPTGEGDETKNIVPTAMVLKKIRGDDVTWLCGFDAVRWAKKNPEKGSYIVDIKSLLLNLEGKKRYFDQDGQSREFSNREIVTVYLKFLIERSKRYFGIDFKSVHITTPVAYPERQRIAYENILRDLGFSNIKNKLDEARAPLYHFLSAMVENKWLGKEDESARDIGGKSIGYLIIDCGGGSTDATLLSDIFVDEPERSGRGVTMSTAEPGRGGNPNFGGKNLTELLFNYLKMRIYKLAYPEEFRKLASGLSDTDYLIDALIQMQEQDIFWMLYREENECLAVSGIKNEEIPEKQHELAYEVFEKIAKEVEQRFPTCEERFQNLDFNTWEKIHRNHSTLLQLAELLKVSIYATDSPKSINILDLPDAPEAVFWLGASPQSKLEKHTAKELKNGLVFHTYELNKLFRPNIFKEISRILRQLDIKKLLKDEDKTFFNVRFVGQSTNIPLFNEALAFFVPRSQIEAEDRDYQDKGKSRFQPIPAEEKKICCVTGAAKFLSHIASGCLKNDDFVASTRVLKNFCRFGNNGLPISVGVYNANGDPDEDGYIIKRDTPMSQARGAILRDLADDMIEFFGTTYDEIVTLEGFINFHQDDMDHELTDEEKKAVEARWDTLFHLLGSETDNDVPMVLIDVTMKESGTANRYEFRPYSWSKQRSAYVTTSEPLEMNFMGN